MHISTDMIKKSTKERKVSIELDKSPINNFFSESCLLIIAKLISRSNYITFKNKNFHTKIPIWYSHFHYQTWSIKKE